MCVHPSPPPTTDLLQVTQELQDFPLRSLERSSAFTVPLGKRGPNREPRMAATQTVAVLSMVLPRGPVATLTLAYSCDYIKEKASKGASVFHSSAVSLPLVIEHVKGTLPHYLQLPFFKHLPVFSLLLDEHIPLLREHAVEVNQRGCLAIFCWKEKLSYVFIFHLFQIYVIS